MVSNDLHALAAEIAAFYKQRWQIELFFKCIKQNLKIRHFLRASENAVRIQLIAYLLLRLAQIGTGTELGLQAIARSLVKTTFQCRSLAVLFELPPDKLLGHSDIETTARYATWRTTRSTRRQSELPTALRPIFCRDAARYPAFASLRLHDPRYCFARENSKAENYTQHGSRPGIGTLSPGLDFDHASSVSACVSSIFSAGNILANSRAASRASRPH